MSSWSKPFVSAALGLALTACGSEPVRAPVEAPLPLSAPMAEPTSAPAAAPVSTPTAKTAASGDQVLPPADQSATSPSPPPPIPERAAAEFAQALNYLKAGQSIDAELEFKQLALAYPEYSGPHVNLGILLAHAGKLAEAESAFKAALERNPNNAVASNELGIVYRKQGKFKEAEAAYQQAIAADPSYALAHLNLGVLCDVYWGDPARAATEYEQYLKLVGDNKQVAAWMADARKRGSAKSPAAEVK